MWLISDLHLGAKRTAGTTPASQKALADWQFSQLDKLLRHCRGGELLVNGDLFDGFTVDNNTLLTAIYHFDALLAESQTRLVLVPGNHDLSKDSSKLSSFHTFAEVLCRLHTDSVDVCLSATRHGPAYIIPHVANQDLFDEELKRVPQDADFVLLHCNYDNHFAEQSDHSLNLSEAQAMQLPGFIVLGHEHQHRYALDERVIVVGNQIPTSVADCLGPRYKYVAALNPSLRGVRLEPWLDVSSVFARLEWRSLHSYGGSHKFIRVEGDAQAAEAAEVITAIAKFRAKSEAFVVTNAVAIEGTNVMAGVVESLENARSFDVFDAILSILDEREVAVVKRLYGMD